MFVSVVSTCQVSKAISAKTYKMQRLGTHFVKEQRQTIVLSAAWNVLWKDLKEMWQRQPEERKPAKGLRKEAVRSLDNGGIWEGIWTWAKHRPTEREFPNPQSKTISISQLMFLFTDEYISFEQQYEQILITAVF